MKKYLMLLAAAGMFVFTSCDNDDDEPVTPPAPTKTELLTSGGWKISAATVNPAIDYDGDGTKENDLLPFFAACEKDDLTFYKSDKTYTEEEGATKCDPNDPQVYTTGTWTFTNNETVLTTTPSGSSSPTSYNIVELTNTTFKYTESYTDSGVTYTATVTLTH